MNELSAGTVLFNQNNDKIEYLLLNYPTGHWDFPKGNIEEGEAEMETVRREIKEETSIDSIEFINGFRKKIKYNYKRREKFVYKEVIFYLSETKDKNVKLSFEHKDYAWLNYNDAMKLLTYKNAKIILEEVNILLTKS
ncbi:MAG: NUDIX domain-containing protein [Thaumarchaeota archaeon]|nr:NUDIX domain-containing protein [Nitrososphaerota archaeon]